MKILAFAFLLLSLDVTIYAQDNESRERWKVKTLTDGFQPNDSVWHTTVHSLVSIDSHYPGNNASRTELETRVVEITAILVGYKRERDSDIHLVLKDTSTGETMNAEIPLAGYAPQEYRMLFDSLRSDLQRFGKAPTPTHKLRNPDKKRRVLVSIRGVLFVDRLHGTVVEAKNGLECHPVLTMRFLP